MNETFELKIKELQSTVTEQVNVLHDILEEFQAKFNEIRSKFNVDEKYKFILKGEANLNIEFETGEFYKDGTPKKTGIEITFQKDWISCEKTELGYTFKINPYTAGSFDPTSNSYLVDYYGLVGMICSNKEFSNTIKSTMHELAIKVNPVRNKISDIRHEIAVLKSEEENRLKEIKENEKFNIIKNEYLKYEYVLIQKEVKNKTPKFIYRNKLVDILKYGTFEECEKELKELSKWNKYSIVQSNKVKF